MARDLSSEVAGYGVVLRVLIYYFFLIVKFLHFAFLHFVLEKPEKGEVKVVTCYPATYIPPTNNIEV